MTASINGERIFWQSLMDLDRIGTTSKGGSCRFTWRALDGQGRDRVVGWLREAGTNVLLGVKLAQTE